MNKISRLLGITLLFVLSSASLIALPLQTNNSDIKAVPAPGPVKIDGSSEDWDLSGEMLVYPARIKREKTSVKVYAMYDKDNLYLLMKWRDSSPLVNRVDANTSPDAGWMGDALQMRFITDQMLHITAYYSTKSDKSVVHITPDTGQPNGPGSKLFRTDGKSLKDPSGVEEIFVEDADKRGYTQELKIPWSILFKDPSKVKAGMSFTFTGEYFWGGPSGTNWPATNYADPINPANPQRVVLYQNSGAWGKMILSEKGNFPKVQAEADNDKLQGIVSLKFKVPADAKKFTVVIDDDKGNRVRNLVAHVNVEDYLIPGKKDEIEVMWDGKINGFWNKDLNLFLGDVTTAGKYTARAIVHPGVGVTYAGNFYNPGLPPWDAINDEGGRMKMFGGWGFDHSIPHAVGIMPTTYKGEPRVFLGWGEGETGVGFIALNKDNQKIWSYIARGQGAHYIVPTDKYVYFNLGPQDILRLNPDKLGSQDPKDPEIINFGNGQPKIHINGDTYGPVTGLTISGGQIFASTGKGKLLAFDAESGDAKGEVENKGITRLTSGPEGFIYGVSASGELMRFKAGQSPEPVKLAGVNAAAVAFDTKGKMYISDKDEKTVKVFANGNPDAKLEKTLGEKGGHQPGPWNAQRMNEAMSLAIEEIDGKQIIWVVENSQSPRRISTWGEDGKLAKDYIGNTRYQASGGFMSDTVPDMGFIDGVRFKIDYANQTYTPLEILVGPSEAKEGQFEPFLMTKFVSDQSLSFGNGYHFISKASGKEEEYINENSAVFMKRNGRWRAVAVLGNAQMADSYKLPSKAPTPTSVFSWNDTNKDGFVSAEEITWKDFGKKDMMNGGWGYKPDTKTLTYYHSGFGFKPVKFTDDGAPIYDVNQGEKLPEQAGEANGQMSKTQFGWTASRRNPLDGDGIFDKLHGVIFGLNDITGYDNKGNLRWVYPNFWCAVHGGMTAPMAMPGVIMGSLKTTGITEYDGYSVISIRGNHGQEFLLRDDGIYIGELFTDARMDPEGLPPVRDLKQVIGMPLNNTSLGQECFNGWFGRQSDGKTRMTYGNTDVRIAEVSGIEKIKNLDPLPIDFTDKLVAEAKAFQPKLGASQGQTTYVVSKGGEIAPDGKVFDATDVIRVFQGKEEVGQAVIRFDDNNLYVGWRVIDSTPLQNLGKKAENAFKTGDSVNLFIAEDKNYGKTSIEGIRVLLTNLSGKPTAVVYKPTGSGKPYTFESPVRKTTFQYVSEEPSIKFNTTPGQGDYIVSATIPWSVLGLKPGAGTKFKADIGILFSDPTGGNIGKRVQWVDKETNVINDEPTESEFFPAKWGTFELKQ